MVDVFELFPICRVCYGTVHKYLIMLSTKRDSFDGELNGGLCLLHKIDQIGSPTKWEGWE
jgi:hypothetical protein